MRPLQLRNKNLIPALQHRFHQTRARGVPFGCTYVHNDLYATALQNLDFFFFIAALCTNSQLVQKAIALQKKILSKSLCAPVHVRAIVPHKSRPLLSPSSPSGKKVREGDEICADEKGTQTQLVEGTSLTLSNNLLH